MIPVYWWQLVALCVLVAMAVWTFSKFYWAIRYSNDLVDVYERRGTGGVLDVVLECQAALRRMPKFMGGRG